MKVDWQTLLEQRIVEASAPCRVDMGGTLDLSTFYLPMRHLKPCTFNIALDMRTRVRLAPYTKGKLKISSLGFESLEVASETAPYDHPLGLMIAVAAYFKADGVHIQIDSASPPRSALGGSSVAAVALIWAFLKASLPDDQLAHMRQTSALLAHAIEQSVAGVPCGLQDQLAAAYGGASGWYWQTEPDGPLFRREDLLSSDAGQLLSNGVVVAYCGAPHVSKDVNGTWVREFLSGKRREHWRQIAECAGQFVDALKSGQLETAQDAMNRETQLRIDMTPDVLDEMGYRLVESARDMTCAARFTGAGGGGCIWALAGSDKVEHLRSVWTEMINDHPSAELLETAIDTTGVL